MSAVAASMLVSAAPFDSASATDAPIDANAVEVDTLDVLQLGCEGRERDDVAVIACRWTVPDGAVGVRVFRLIGGPGEWRQVVHRTGDPWSNTFVDADIERGVRYLYVVQAVGAAGQIVAMSRPGVAGVAPLPDPAVEVLRLDCSATGDVTVRCAWSDPKVPARTLTLWRSVDGAIRERVASFAHPFPTSYGDVVPRSSSQAVYAVIATDGAGEIVARSRAQIVDLAGPTSTVEAVPTPSRTVPPTTVPPTTVPPTTVLPTTVPVTTVPTRSVPAITVPTTASSSTVVQNVDEVQSATTAPQRPVAVPAADEPEPVVDRDVVVDPSTVDASAAPEPVRSAAVERERAG